MKHKAALTRRTALALPLFGLTRKLFAAAPPDAVKETHQLGIMLLILNETKSLKIRTDFLTQTYTEAAYATTVFAKNGIAYSTFRAAQAPYQGNTPQIKRNRANLIEASKRFREQMQVMGTAVQAATTPYPPEDPCPYGDAQLNFNAVMKLTRL
jgi:hypothetical protein